MRSKSSQQGFRTRHRAEIKAKQRILAVKVAAACALLIFISAAGARLIGGDSDLESKTAVKPASSQNQEIDSAKKIVKKQPVKAPKKAGKLLVGVMVGGKAGKRDSLYHSLVFIDGNQAKIISLPGDLVTNIDKEKYEKLQSAIRLGGHEAFLISLNTLGINNIRHFMVLPKDFGDLSPGNLADAFLKAKETSLSSEKRVKLSERLKKSSITKIYYPIKEVRVGNDHYSQPLESELSEINTLLGVENKDAKRLKVLIMNGNGEPGIGGKIALRLLKNGYLIDDIRNLKNAEGKDNFNQAETIAYGDIKYNSEILRLLTILGVGKKVEAKPLAGTQITLVVGKDFK